MRNLGSSAAAAEASARTAADHSEHSTAKIGKRCGKGRAGGEAKDDREHKNRVVGRGGRGVLLIGAWVVRPRPIAEGEIDIGQEFFAEFRDPNAATSLEVVEYDKESGGVRPFKVAEVNGIWSIPSHEGYPADAKNQLEQAAASVIGLSKLSLVSESRHDHEMYGVLDPEDTKAEGSAEAVGKRITLEDKSGNKLAQFIIGKADPDKPELHFVRVPGQDRVYRAWSRPTSCRRSFRTGSRKTC